MPVIPISTHRAISHAANPRVAPTDTIMHIAWQDGVMVGYLGVLADGLYDAHATLHRCGWLSCMWVDPALRGKGIAKQLLASVMAHWGEHILVTEFTPEAKALYDRSGKFVALGEKQGLRCFLRFEGADVLCRKHPRLEPVKPLLQLADTLLNIPNDLRLKLVKSRYATTDRSWEPIQQIDSDTATFINNFRTNTLVQRSAIDIDWILQYPWLIPSTPTTESRRYHFSSVAGVFATLCYRLVIGGKIQAVVIMTIRDGHIKIPYLYTDESTMAQVMSHIYDTCYRHSVHTMTIYQPLVIAYLARHRHPFIYLHAISRSYIITQQLAAHIATGLPPLLQDGDADCAFT
jgi:GNAT superfamily N-acetyltransferase